MAIFNIYFNPDRHERIRTSDPRHPMTVRYQAAPHADLIESGTIIYCSQESFALYFLSRDALNGVLLVVVCFILTTVPIEIILLLCD